MRAVTVLLLITCPFAAALSGIMVYSLRPDHGLLDLTHWLQGSGKELIQPVLDNQLKAASPLVLPAKVRAISRALAVLGTGR